MQPVHQLCSGFAARVGLLAPQPSTAMTEALRQLSQAQEMEPLLRKAPKEAGREVVIEVFQRAKTASRCSSTLHCCRRTG